MPFAVTWMDQEINILSEVSRQEKDKYRMISHRWNLKKKIQMNLLTKQRLTDLDNKLTATKVDGGRGDKLGIWDEQIPITIHKIGKHQEPTVQRRELHYL